MVASLEPDVIVKLGGGTSIVKVFPLAGVILVIPDGIRVTLEGGGGGKLMVAEAELVPWVMVRVVLVEEVFVLMVMGGALAVV